MYRREEVSPWPRRAFVVAHLAMVALSAWILLGTGTEVLGRVVGRSWIAGDPGRRWLLASFALVLWLRMSATVLVLLERRFTWQEMGVVSFGAAMYQFGFACLGVASSRALGAWDVVAVALFAAGSALNTGSEWARLRFKRRPENRGRLYTRGPFALVRHPNYLGDVVWGVGWAVATRSGWSAVIVVAEVAGFVFVNIPQLSAHLEQRYGEAYRTWASRTARLVPWIY